MNRRKAIGGSLAMTAVITAATVTYAVFSDSDAEPPAESRRSSAISGKVHRQPLRDLPGSGASTSTTTSKKVKGLPPTATEPFSLVGVT
jgi:hypothetical protein